VWGCCGLPVCRCGLRGVEGRAEFREGAGRRGRPTRWWGSGRGSRWSCLPGLGSRMQLMLPTREPALVASLRQYGAVRVPTAAPSGRPGASGVLDASGRGGAAVVRPRARRATAGWGSPGGRAGTPHGDGDQKEVAGLRAWPVGPDGSGPAQTRQSRGVRSFEFRIGQVSLRHAPRHVRIAANPLERPTTYGR
jgi:hypothetical protein